MSKEIMDFQRATADRIADIFRAGKQHRVLLADEVGLGKTIMAKAVIDRVRKIPQIANDNMYRVVYVCSNMNIIKQNTGNLGINDVLNITESRLSMQHLTLQEKVNDLNKKKIENGKELPELLLPLTPGTSFNLSAPLGTMPERALLYNLLVKMDEFRGEQKKLNDIFKSRYVTKTTSWDGYVRWYKSRIEKCDKECGNTYIQSMHYSFRSQPEWNDVKSEILNECKGSAHDHHVLDNCILKLRRMSALISIQQLNPDLIIMDEFQRFSSLLNKDTDDEENMIAREFFGETPKEGGDEPFILLLSATPYKPYTTLEELNENNCDAQYEDFITLMNFLFKNHPEEKFDKVWGDYSRALSQLNTNNFAMLLAHKDNAEDTLYKAMCRTERPNTSLIIDNHKDLEISEGDVLSFAHMQKVFDDCRRLTEEYPEKKLGFKNVNVPMDYVKSSPYLLSFMDRYELKNKITKEYETLRNEKVKLPVSIQQQTYLLKHDAPDKYKDIKPNNARLAMLIKEAFANHAERLLWIPASHPYYSTLPSNVFEKNKSFSKILVFSAWEMVPRMIATMLSYEAEKRSIGEAFDEATYRNNKGLPSLSEQMLCYPSQFLADLYNPKEYYGQNIADIRKSLTIKLQEAIHEVNPNICIEGYETSEKRVKLVAQCLDEVEESVWPNSVSSHVISVLVNAAIGSPAVCALRILKDKNKAESLANKFRSLFNRRTSAAILSLIYERKDQDVYYEQVLDYCVMGNLQAVLDEFVYMIGGDSQKIYDTMSESFIEITSLDVDTTTTFAKKNSKKIGMRVHYAVPFNQAKVDEKKVKRSNSVRQAFNSPFRPFVLASTSVGQEGLDFHWYCRKIMHWNLPSNPQDMEQREGRINRFQCLAIRRNIAHLYPDYFSWKEIFDEARNDLHRKYPDMNDMVPFWCLPPELISEKSQELEMIERIIPNYPMSIDGERYKRLISVLSLYRLTMGQPRQEELLQLIGDKMDEEQIKQLLFDLSPYSHNKNAHLKRIK